MTPIPGKSENAPPTQSSGQAETLSGLVYAQSDVSNQPDNPMPGQLVVLLPEEVAPDLLGSGQSLEDKDLRFLRKNLDKPDARIQLVVTDTSGKYQAKLTPGNYILCLADYTGSPPTYFPISLRGCGRLGVQAGRSNIVNVSSGFGEIVLERP